MLDITSLGGGMRGIIDDFYLAIERERSSANYGIGSGVEGGDCIRPTS